MNEKITALIILSFICVLLFTSCVNNDVVDLISILTEGGYDQSFVIQANITADLKFLRDNGLTDETSDELSAIPKTLPIELTGNMYADKNFEMKITINNDDELTAGIYKKDDFLYVETGDAVVVAVNFLSAMGFYDPIKLNVFLRQAASYKYIAFDVTGFDMEYFRSYLEYGENFLKLDTTAKKFTPVMQSSFGFTPDTANTAYFDKLSLECDNILYETVGYRMSDLRIIVSREVGKAFVNTVGTRENGELVFLDPQLIKIDLADDLDSKTIFNAHILPMRYICELFRLEVDYDYRQNKAFYWKRNGEKVYFEGTVTDDTTYTSIGQFLINGFDINIGTADDEFIELFIGLTR